MEACNPAKAKKVLEHNIEAGYFLPCKVVEDDLIEAIKEVNEI